MMFNVTRLKTFFSKKNYIEKEIKRCDKLLSDIDGKTLDHQQRTVVVSDENRNLCIAGAGSGKTLTIAGKVKYLCTEKGIDPEDILLISFTKKAAEEMTERISDKLNIPITATTFHKLGLDIIASSQGKCPDVYDNLGAFVKSYFESHIVKDAVLVKALIEYFAYYLYIPHDMEKFDSLGAAFDYEKGLTLETIKGKYESKKYIEKINAERRTSRVTLQNEQVKSLDEVSIANFLFLHGIQYEYETTYPYDTADNSHRSYKPDFYLPEYDIYIEHFGINRQGKAPWLSNIEETKYIDGMSWKRAVHKEHGTKLLETYSYYSSEGCLLSRLESMLKENGVKFKEPDFLNIFNTIYGTQSDKHFVEFIKLCCTFITLYKSNGYKSSDLSRLKSKNSKYNSQFFIQRTKIFMSLISPLLASYDEYLESKSSIDFSDMINLSAEIINSGFAIHPYKWIIVDEYQDISVARYKLVNAILNQTGAKLLCVGDDWQSIFRFAGSDISLFTNFEKYFGKAKIMKIEKTYRNSQELINQAGQFIMKNPKQIKKHLTSEKSILYPILLMYYYDDPLITLKQTIDKIIEEFGEAASIMLLGRTNYDAEMIAKSSFLEMDKNGSVTYNNSPATPISFLSVHKSKGLEADNTILLNFQNSTLGFPNKISNDPILELVLTSEDDYLYSEERRLFYVALTRTKNRAYVLTDGNNPSEFCSELNITKSVLSFSDTKTKKADIPCPHCKTGHLVVRNTEGKNKNFLGCSNYPQCNYTVNDTSLLDYPKTCPVCKGYMVKRNGTNGPFYGCSNYPICRNTEQIGLDTGVIFSSEYENK